jgi:hypothetical protein
VVYLTQRLLYVNLHIKYSRLRCEGADVEGEWQEGKKEVGGRRKEGKDDKESG